MKKEIQNLKHGDIFKFRKDKAVYEAMLIRKGGYFAPDFLDVIRLTDGKFISLDIDRRLTEKVTVLPMYNALTKTVK